MTTPVTNSSAAVVPNAAAAPNGASTATTPPRSAPAHGQDQPLPQITPAQVQDARLSLQMLQVRQLVAEGQSPDLSAFAAQTTQSANSVSAPSADLAYDGGTSYNPQVEELQRGLVAAGYMTEADMATGPGYYGPRTREAVAELQGQHGIAGNDGNNYGPQSRAALQQDLAGSSGPVPGSGTTPGTPNTDGSIRYWDVPNINQMNSNGSADDWNASSNCGPTSMAMIARAFGFGGDMSDGTLVNWLGSQIGITGDGTPGNRFDDMARACGFGTEENWSPTTGWIEQQLSEGKLVAINGDASIPSYSDSTPNTGFSGGHWIVVTGMDAQGNFLVQDPSSDCKSLTPYEVQQFFARHDATNGSGVAVAVDSGRAPPDNGGTDPAPKPSPGPAPGNPGNSDPLANAPAPGLAFDGGMTYNPQVEQLQQRLVDTGYLSATDMATGPGYYGPRTQAAVAALQADYGITGNGGNDYGPRTQQALQQALGKSSGDSRVETPTPSGDTQLSPQDAQTASRVDALLENYPNSRMQGMGETLVDACRDEGIPLDLVLAQLGKESTFLSDGVSVPNNNPGNLRFAQWESAFGGVPGQGAFTAFPDVASGIRAYVHLLASDSIPDASYPYSAMIANRDWNALINAFAPASDGNDVAEYVQQLTDWCGYFADKVGIDENWIAQR